MRKCSSQLPLRSAVGSLVYITKMQVCVPGMSMVKKTEKSEQHLEDYVLKLKFIRVTEQMPKSSSKRPLDFAERNGTVEKLNDLKMIVLKNGR